MMTRPMLSILALCAALAACEQNRARAPEGEADAEPAAPDAGPEPEPGPEPDPQCPINIGPLAACEPPAIPPPACTVEINGDRHFTVTLDAGRRRTSLLDAEGNGAVDVYDAGQHRVLHQSIVAGCVVSERAQIPGGIDWITRDRTREGLTCRAGRPDAGGVVHQERDDGCDCLDPIVEQSCQITDFQPTRCTTWRSDGTVREITRWTYDAEGRVTEESVDQGGDGVIDRVETTAYDARGRRVERVYACRDCEEIGGTQRETWTYEDDAGRATHRIDDGDDGRFELVEVTTSVAGRDVLIEREERGVSTRIETEYFDNGGRETTTTVDGRLVRTETISIDRGQTRTTTVTPESTTIEWINVDDAGRLVRRRIERDPGPDFLEELTWDEDGRLIAERVTIDDEDGPRTCAVDYRWSGDCPGPHGRFNQPCAALTD